MQGNDKASYRSERCRGNIAAQRFTQEFGARAMLFLPYFFEFCRHFWRERYRERNGDARHMMGKRAPTCCFCGATVIFVDNPVP